MAYVEDAGANLPPAICRGCLRGELFRQFVPVGWAFMFSRGALGGVYPADEVNAVPEASRDEVPLDQLAVHAVISSPLVTSLALPPPVALTRRSNPSYMLGAIIFAGLSLPAGPGDLAAGTGAASDLTDLSLGAKTAATAPEDSGLVDGANGALRDPQTGRFAPNPDRVAPEPSDGLHGNSRLSEQPTYLYQLYDLEGSYLKTGITSESNPAGRYTRPECRHRERPACARDRRHSRRPRYES